MKIIIILTLLFFCISPSHASVQLKLQNCVQISDDKSRLQCYDKVANNLVVAKKTASLPTKPNQYVQAAPVNKAKPVATPAQPQADKAELERFGNEHKAKETQVKAITVQVTKITTNALKKRTVYLQNGMVWRETEVNSLFKLKVGDMVSIERGWFGSFSMSKAGTNRAMRVKRVQ